MKTSILSVLAALIAQTVIASAAENAALLKSPRFIEEHPELTRSMKPKAPASKVSRLAKTPRNIEEYPELVRTGSIKAFSPAKERNAGWASTPRAREENPALARTSRSPAVSFCDCLVMKH